MKASNQHHGNNENEMLIGCLACNCSCQFFYILIFDNGYKQEVVCSQGYPHCHKKALYKVLFRDA